MYKLEEIHKKNQQNRINIKKRLDSKQFRVQNLQNSSNAVISNSNRIENVSIEISNTEAPNSNGGSRNYYADQHLATEGHDEDDDEHSFDMVAYLKARTIKNHSLKVTLQSFQDVKSQNEGNQGKEGNQGNEGNEGRKGEKRTHKVQQNQKQNMPKLITQSVGLIRLEQLFIRKEPVTYNYVRANNLEWESKLKSYDTRLYLALKNFPNIKEFKNNQKAIIKCELAGNNIFVCMPTGGGKSLTFQALTFLSVGVYLCVLPLISLIHDQEQQAKQFGIEAYSLTANTDQNTVKIIYNNLYNFSGTGNSILIFCTPEKLNLSQNFMETIEMVYKRGYLTRIIIDEVHCVSTWGKQFRKEYENLSKLKERFPYTPILALTATVTEIVKQDIIRKLKIEKCLFFQSSFNRSNLYYCVKQKRKQIVSDIHEYCLEHRNQSGIIYCLSRRECEDLSEKLNQMGHKTGYYHAEVDDQSKKYLQDEWMRDQIHIIIATVAFGMGINKPNVRFVIHYTMSKSLENYYQESGRAGRDGFPSECLLFYRKSDKTGLQVMTMKNDYSTIESKEFSTKQLASMIKYCEEKFLCRRKFQLQYLGEKDFDERLCEKTCDNCQNGKSFKEYECIEHGKLMIEYLLKVEATKMNISKNQFMMIMRSKIEKGLEYKFRQLQKSGIDFLKLQLKFQGWKIDEIDSLFLEFFSFDVLTEKIVETEIFGNKGNVNNAYLKCNSARCHQFLRQAQSLPIRRESLAKNNLRRQATKISEDDSNDFSFHPDLQNQIKSKVVPENQEKRKARIQMILAQIQMDGEQSFEHVSDSEETYQK